MNASNGVLSQQNRLGLLVRAAEDPASQQATLGKLFLSI